MKFSRENVMRIVYDHSNGLTQGERSKMLLGQYNVVFENNKYLIKFIT